jgi:hypothetical protein
MTSRAAMTERNAPHLRARDVGLNRGMLAIHFFAQTGAGGAMRLLFAAACALAVTLYASPGHAQPVQTTPPKIPVPDQPMPEQPPPAPRPLTLLDSLAPLSHWAIGSATNCRNPKSFYSLELGPGVITWRNGIGNTDVESVIFSSATEFRTTTQSSVHVDNRNEKFGQTWTYTKSGSDRISVTPGGRASFLLVPCP